MWYMRTATAGAACGLLLLGGCASPNPDGTPRSNLDKAAANCTATMIGTTVIGVLVGAATNRTGTGAAIGAGVGAVACAAMLAIANEKDRAQIRENERMAVASDSATARNYVVDGVARSVSTTVAPAPPRPPQPKKAPPPAATPTATPPPSPSARTEQTEPKEQVPDAPQVCRYASTTVTVAGKGVANGGQQLWCRQTNGDWELVET